MTPIQRLARDAPLGAQVLRHDSVITERPGWYQISTPSGGPSVNEVMRSDLDDVEPVVDAMLEHYAGRTFQWVVDPFTQAPGLSAVLEDRGFENWAARAMVQTASTLQANAWPELPVESVTADNLPAVCEVLGAVVKRDPAILVDDYSNWLEVPGRRMFAGMHDGQVVGMSAMQVRQGSAYLCGGAVLPGFRGQGVYRAMVAARIRALPADHLVTTWAREATSAPILERLGFDTAFRLTMYRQVA